MKYKYPKRKKSFTLIIGLLWMGLAIFGILEDQAKMYEYIALFLGLIYFGLALHMQIASYVTVTDAEIIKNNLIPIRIPFSEIVELREVGEVATIFGKDHKIKIYKRNIQKKQRPQFEAFLKTLTIEKNNQ